MGSTGTKPWENKVSLDRLLEVVQDSWGIDTVWRDTQRAVDSEDWMQEIFEQNRAFSQCVVTALVIQDWMGGQIVKANDGRKHWFNILPDGTPVDLTIEQFEEDDRDYGAGEFADRRELLNRCGSRYIVLRDRVADKLNA